MTKLNKIKVGSLAVAMVLMSIAWSVAQTPATGAQSTKPKNPAAAELKSFQADPANPELSEARLLLLQAKEELEAGQVDNTLSQDKINSLNRRINLLETKIKEMTPQEAEKPQTNSRKLQAQSIQRDEVIKQAKETSSITRDQFVNLDAADQKFIMVNNIKISDLVNATSAQLRTQQDNIFYISVADFSNYSLEKQIHILNNPATYLVAESVPVPEVAKPGVKSETSEKFSSEIKKTTISRSELNSLSPEKRNAIENSGDFVITE